MFKDFYTAATFPDNELNLGGCGKKLQPPTSTRHWFLPLGGAGAIGPDQLLTGL